MLQGIWGLALGSEVSLAPSYSATRSPNTLRILRGTGKNRCFVASVQASMGHSGLLDSGSWESKIQVLDEVLCAAIRGELYPVRSTKGVQS